GICLTKFCLKCKEGIAGGWTSIKSFLNDLCQFLRKYKTSMQTALLLLFIFFFVTLYKIQYKTGIEIIPFLPIDVSGFDQYNENLLVDIDVSESALSQQKKGFLFCWVMTAPIHHTSRVKAVNSTWLPKCDAGHFYTTMGIISRKKFLFIQYSMLYPIVTLNYFGKHVWLFFIHINMYQKNLIGILKVMMILMSLWIL
ncbi:unnamed protein product, partial [Mesorhabditis belari]|uniref:Uncharacterized protein n=1 Tax=Mesorhabditis belari TaxID=2138241 RepID=A0AAF3FJC3_9BILA